MYTKKWRRKRKQGGTAEIFDLCPYIFKDKDFLFYSYNKTAYLIKIVTYIPCKIIIKLERKDKYDQNPLQDLSFRR